MQTPEDKEKEEAILALSNKIAGGILGALDEINMPGILKMAVLGGCLAEVVKRLPKDAQLSAFIHHIMGMRAACGFQQDIGVMPMSMQEKDDGQTDDERNATRH